MKNNILTLFSLFFVTICFSQKVVTWQDLSKVTFSEKFFPKFNETFLHPAFSASVKALEGKQIKVKGYFLNIDPNGKLYILSKGPMSACFFCGVGGPETAIELQFSKKQKFKTDDIVTVTGTLKLNSSDVEHFNYILTDCKAKLIDKF